MNFATFNEIASIELRGLKDFSSMSKDELVRERYLGLVSVSSRS
jgi:hypothetical protein